MTKMIPDVVYLIVTPTGVWDIRYYYDVRRQEWRFAGSSSSPYYKTVEEAKRQIIKHYGDADITVVSLPKLPAVKKEEVLVELGCGCCVRKDEIGVIKYYPCHPAHRDSLNRREV